MQATNYRRKALEYFLSAPPRNKQGTKIAVEILQKFGEAEAFILPSKGRIFDTDFTHVPETLKLPFEHILLEYSVPPEEGEIRPGEYYSSRRIILAEQAEEWIRFCSVYYVDALAEWGLAPFVGWVRLRREEDAEIRPSVFGDTASIVVPTVVFNFSRLYEDKGLPADWRSAAKADLAYEATCLIALLEALACSNVEAQAIPRKPLNKHQRRSGVPEFDTYHELVVRASGGLRQSNDRSSGGGGARREHLRRGHIRHHPTAGNIWVNSCVVNPGIGSKVSKTYVIK